MLEEIKNIILSCRPDWTFDSLRYLNEGDSCTVYVANDEWIFRFAKHDAARKSLQRESCLLPKLAARITLRLPAPQISCFEGDAKSSFIAYPFLRGAVLSPERFAALDDESKTACAEQGARFLNELHSTDVRLAENCGVSVNDYAAQYSALRQSARKTLFAVPDAPECLFIERVLDNYLASAADFRPVLLHGDLSPDHFIFDEQTRRISAVIDFGDVSVGDAAWDFVWIYEHYGLDFLSRMLPEYRESDKLALLRRIFQFSLLEAVEWTVGCQTKGGADFAEALTRLQTKMMQEKTRAILLEKLGG